MKDSERRMKGRYQNRTVLISEVGQLRTSPPVIKTNPMAYVRQSDPGAKAVMGSNIVRQEIFSEVDGSKRITSPFSFPSITHTSMLRTKKI